MVRLILETAREQKRFCQKKEGKSLESDLEVVLNAKGGPKVISPGPLNIM